MSGVGIVNLVIDFLVLAGLQYGLNVILSSPGFLWNILIYFLLVGCIIDFNNYKEM